MSRLSYSESKTSKKTVKFLSYEKPKQRKSSLFHLSALTPDFDDDYSPLATPDDIIERTQTPESPMKNTKSFKVEITNVDEKQ